MKLNEKTFGDCISGLVDARLCRWTFGWCGTHEVVQSNSASITFRYDTILGANKICEFASEHCKKFDKEAVPTAKTTQALVIAIQTFQCK
jgi:hypothetical protein